MKKITILILLPFFAFSQEIITEKKLETKQEIITDFDFNSFHSALNNAIGMNGSGSSVNLNFPGQDGQMKKFRFEENLITAEHLESIKTYKGVSIDKESIARISITSDGEMTGIIHTPKGYYFIGKRKDVNHELRVYQNSSSEVIPGLSEKSNRELKKNLSRLDKNLRKTNSSVFPFGDKLYKYRLAVATPIGFATRAGGKTQAINTIVQVINMVNLIFERDFSVKFELISKTTNGSLIFEQGGSYNPYTKDPTNPDDSQDAFDNMEYDNYLNYDEYDLGQTFKITQSTVNGMNGSAEPMVCDDGYNALMYMFWTDTFHNNLVNNLPYLIGRYAHFLGDQFYLGHTANTYGGYPGNENTLNYCTDRLEEWSMVEPTAGNTIMGFFNMCYYPYNFINTDVYEKGTASHFHTFSIKEMYEDAILDQATCYVIENTGNHPPVAFVGPDITIPKMTAFVLRGLGNDQDGDELYYSWDQMDVADEDDIGALGYDYGGVGGYAAVNSTTAPIFKSSFSQNPERYFPDIRYVLGYGSMPFPNVGEHLSSVARDINFNFTVRDGRGGVDSKEFKVTVADVGPFYITSYYTRDTLITGNNYNLEWEVNGTDILASKVKILLSVDGGNSFPYVLSESTDNDGSFMVNIPSWVPSTNKARFKVMAKINDYAEFYNINEANITIESDCDDVISVKISPEEKVEGESGNAVLNLDLSPGADIEYGKFFTMEEVLIEKLVGYTNGSMNTCGIIHDGYVYVQPVKFRVDVSGNYIFRIRAPYFGDYGTTLFSLYSSPNLGCDDFLGSNFFGTSFEDIDMYEAWQFNLTANQDYYMRVYLTEPQIFLFDFAGPGKIFDGDDLNGGFTYFALDPTDNKVKHISTNSDFRSLPAGEYQVYGLNYETGFNPATLVEKTMEYLLTSSNCKAISSNYIELTVLQGDDPCPPNQNLTGLAVSGILKASETISSTQVVDSGKNVEYQAAKSILLTPQSGSGFEVKEGGVFKAEIKNCD